MKKNWTKVAIVLGPAIIIASVVWEFARTNPDYNFLIQPWSLRGYETDFGASYVALGALLLIGGIATTWEGALRDSVSASIAGYFVIALTLFAFVFGNEEVTVSVTSVMAAFVSLLLASSVALALRSLFGETKRLFRRALPPGVVLFAVFFLLASVSVVGSELTMRPWVLVFVVSLAMGGLAVAIRPINMAANRMLMFAAVAGWLVILLSAGAIRQSLVDEQLLTEQTGGAIGVAAQYKDTQAAYGWWIAGMGVTILFIGAVGLWARRRDIVSALQRARKQREAAEISAREIQEAAEAYAREQAAASQPPAS